jgi:CheY-like chemotaxis protein
MKPVAVASGAEAMDEMLRAARDGTPFPLVILDGMMPEMDGFMVAEKIDGHPELAGAAVMMLSSAMTSGATARCAALGVASYLTKPVCQAELLEAILVTIGGTQRKQSERSSVRHDAGPERHAHPLRILLAEDNVINRALATGILEKRGHSLVHATNGREAVEAAAREIFDIIFMDIQMPEMDGFEATAEIRKIEGVSKHTTIIAMTAHALEGERDKCLRAGMDDYISKPVKMNVLKETLEQWIGTAIAD